MANLCISLFYPGSKDTFLSFPNVIVIFEADHATAYAVAPPFLKRQRLTRPMTWSGS